MIPKYKNIDNLCFGSPTANVRSSQAAVARAAVPGTEAPRCSADARITRRE